MIKCAGYANMRPVNVFPLLPNLHFASFFKKNVSLVARERQPSFDIIDYLNVLINIFSLNLFFNPII
jgi:hypothetical protein